MADDFQTWTLPTKHLGQRVHVYDSLDSTNTLTLSLGHDPTQHGLVVLARTQSAGRGQYGRSWVAPPRTSVLMSVLLFPPPSLRRPALLTAFAAVSVCETIVQLTGRQPTIKWPNDVLIDRKKVCGILIEQRSAPHASVVGIGLNVSQTAETFAQAGLPDAASLASLSGLSFVHEDLAKALICQLDEQYHLLIEGDLQTLEASWKLRLDLVGKRVTIEGVTRQYCGRVLDVSLSVLELETDIGERMHLAPETVRHIHLGEPGA